jgi:hypothetical protein
MAHVVLVHGIANETEAADTIEASWLPALAGGVRIAGFPAISDKLWRNGMVSDGFEVRAAFYGNLFRPKGAQGDAQLDPDVATANGARDLALEWLQRAAVRSVCADEPADAEGALAELGLAETGQAMGLRSVERDVIKRLARLPWFARLGMAIAERFIVRALTQVTAYLTDEAVRAAAQQALLALIDDRTRVVIGHSLGSIVAYESCFRMTRPLPLLLTIGSPLGLQTIVYQRLRPQPPVFPPHVTRWVNVADPDDLVAAEPDLNAGFSRASSPPIESVTINNSSRPHDPSPYLTAVEVGRPVGESLKI